MFIIVIMFTLLKVNLAEYRIDPFNASKSVNFPKKGGGASKKALKI